MNSFKTFNRISKLFSWLIILYSLVACTSTASMPPIDFPEEMLNQDLRITAPEGWNTYQTNDEISLNVLVIGNEKIIFAPDFDVKMFVLNGEHWEEVFNIPIEYSQGDNIVFPRNGNPFNSAVAVLFPNLPFPNHQTLIRIFVFGHVYRNGEKTDEEVGAYINILGSLIFSSVSPISGRC